MKIFTKIIENIKDTYYIGWYRFDFETKHYNIPSILKHEIQDWADDNIKFNEYNYVWNDENVKTAILIKNSKDYMFFKLRWV